MVRMAALVSQMDHALQSKSYFAALFMALALPDICGALESPDGSASGKKYSQWFDKWVSAEKYPGLFSGADCYQFRCALLHQGTTHHPNSGYSRVFFIEPNPRIKMHKNIFNNALNLDLIQFCGDMKQGVTNWLDQATTNHHFKTNEAQLITYHQNGLAPYVMGIPVIG